MNKTIEIPERIKSVMGILLTHNYDVYVVGGAVRDSLMDKEPKDWDLTTDAPKEKITKLYFDRIAHLAGYEFGTVAIKLLDKEIVEITEFRREDQYDGRKPADVEYTPYRKEDARRRDFTINALYADVNGVIIDDFGGVKDIENEIIQTVGHAVDRFGEDHLRMLRALRFAVKYDFNISPEVHEAIKYLAHKITNISNERIKVELDKMIEASAATSLVYLMESGLLKYIIPDLYLTRGFLQYNPAHDFDVYNHIYMVAVYLDMKNASLLVKYAGLFHDIAKPKTFTVKDGIGHFYGHELEGYKMTKDILKAMKFPTAEIKHIANLVRNHLRPKQIASNKSIRKFCRDITQKYTSDDDLEHKQIVIEDIFQLAKADSYGKRGKSNEPDIEKLQETYVKLLEVIATSPSEDKPILDGVELMNIGFSGKAIGDAQKALLNWQDGIESFAFRKEYALEELKGFARDFLGYLVTDGELALVRYTRVLPPALHGEN